MLVAPLFLAVDGVTVAPTSAGVALLVPLPRGDVCISSDLVMLGVLLYPARCRCVLVATVWQYGVSVCWWRLL